MNDVFGVRILLKVIRDCLESMSFRRFDANCAVRRAVSMMLAIGFLMAVASAKSQFPADPSKRPEEASGSVENGRRLYARYGCYECHGLEAQGGGSAGPRIGPDPVPLSALLAYVREPAREMPPYTDKVVSDKELADIYAFLKSLPHPPPANSNPLLH
jgi:mono/diheme cytochrome c family protein